MNDVRNYIQDSDYLLLEQITPSTAGGNTGDIVAIERQDAGGDNQYLLRKVIKDDSGQYILLANNPDHDLVIQHFVQSGPYASSLCATHWLRLVLWMRASSSSRRCNSGVMRTLKRPE